ncbi:MAG TPA: hypothetical protein VEI06_15020 [Gemmatimonadaceae bacterium]|nr:hypothetical protein [Gemmatimonadaceae bacterium]
MRRRPLLTALAGAAVIVLATHSATAQQTTAKPKTPPKTPPKAQTAPPKAGSDSLLDSLTIPHALKARSIGPAVMGGRVSALALDPKTQGTYWVGLATGGVIKTTNMGETFTAVFEKQSVASIGDIAVAPSDSSVIWVGTGEANDRNTVGWGNGVYRSADGGGTWTNVGLANSKSIARIVVHPSDPKTAWVAVVGNLWANSPERGLYKTTDAGATWKLVLSAPAPYGDRVGAGDVAIDPSNPNVLYAVLYARQRKPWMFASGASFTDGKDLGGIFKSVDGGATWKKLTNGLPTRTQRIGLSVFAKNPKTVYAVIQSDAEGNSNIDDITSKTGGVFRSDDAGETWTRMSKLDPRPFYFSQIRVDPENDKLVYVLGFMLHVSEDGGKTWREDRFKYVHADNHALVIDARNTAHLVLGTDGGIYQSFDRAQTWDHLTRVAAGEFFRVNVDMGTPYRICGGLQDNENWVGPSATDTKDGIQNGDWIPISGGDGSWCAFDQTEPNYVYAESQQGYTFRMDLRTADTRNLKPEPTEGQPAYRFHWTSPLIASRHDNNVLYHAGNRVFKLTNHGEHWQVISPDLSSKDYEKTTAVGSGAEDYGVVYTLAESPVKGGLLWAGTDDGKLWKTENDGGAWTDLTPSLPAATKGLWLSRVTPSAFDPLVAYLAVDGHRTGTFTPLVYRTADGGKTWQSIVANLPDGGPVRVIAEDPRNPDLLFAGTEFAFYASLDRGQKWFRFGGLPTVAVDDILIHPRDLDLLIATHGRSLFIVDDIRPLEEFTPAVQGEAAHLFTIRPVTATYQLEGWNGSAGGAVFRGTNPPQGAIITYYIRRYTGDAATIAVTNSAGSPVANLTGVATPGINRVVWDLKLSKDLQTQYGGDNAEKFVPPGEYTVTLTYGTVKQTQKVKVSVAPGIETR